MGTAVIGNKGLDIFKPFGSDIGAVSLVFIVF